MKKLLLSIILLSSFLVCDVPSWNPDYYQITGLPAPLNGDRVLPDATKTYGFKFDMAALPSVTNDTVRNINVAACKDSTDTHTGGCSAFVPFGFTQDYIGSLPTKVRLIK